MYVVELYTFSKAKLFNLVADWNCLAQYCALKPMEQHAYKETQ